MFFHDSDIHLLLAKPIYFSEDNGHQKATIWILLSMWQSLTLENKLSLPNLLTVCCPNWDKQDTKEIEMPNFGKTR